MMVVIRPAQGKDSNTVLELADRLVDFGPPDWRDASQMRDTDRSVLERAMVDTSGVSQILVAEEEGVVVGFIHLTVMRDYYLQREIAHVADIVVRGTSEGRGVGTQLLQAAEVWAKDRDDPWLTLSVFPDNVRALDVYQRQGFRPDTIRLLKPLR